MKQIILISILALAASCLLQARNWTSTAGTTVEGELVDFANRRVTIKTTDGRRLVVQLQLLSPADQKFVLEKYPGNGGNQPSRYVRARPPSRSQLNQVEEALAASFSVAPGKNGKFDELAEFNAWFPGNEKAFRPLVWKAYREGGALKELQPNHKAGKVVSGSYVSPYAVRQGG